MKVTVLPSAVASGIPSSIPGGSAPHAAQLQYATSFLVNDVVAVDAGCLGFVGTPHEQARVRHVLISHSHIDHLASLPIFLENAYEARRDCVVIHGSADVLDCLRQDMFNDRLWPDFVALSAAMPTKPFLKLQQMEAGVPFEVEGLRVLPVPVNHVVPTLGFVISDAHSAFVIVSDTGPTDEIWRVCNATPNLGGVFLEVTFPNEMKALAEVSKHLTPAMFGTEVRKLHQNVPVYAVHVKARFHDLVAAELAQLPLPNVQAAVFGKVYEF